MPKLSKKEKAGPEPAANPTSKTQKQADLWNESPTIRPRQKTWRKPQSEQRVVTEDQENGANSGPKCNKRAENGQPDVENEQISELKRMHL